MSRPPFALLVAALFVAGCLGAEDSPADPMPEAPAAPPSDAAVGDPFTLDDCFAAFGAFPVPADAAPLPEGFAHVPFAGDAATATGFLAGFYCVAARGVAAGEGPVEAAVEGYFVDPPPELALEDAGAHALVRLVASDDAVAARFEGWGLGGKGLSATHLLLGRPGDGAAEIVVSRDGSRWTSRIVTDPTGERDTVDSTDRYFGLGADGTVAGVVDVKHEKGARVWGKAVFDTDAGESPLGAPGGAGLGAHVTWDGPSFTFAPVPPARANATAEA